MHVLVGRHQGVGVLVHRHAGPGQALLDGCGGEERVGGDDDGQPAGEGGAHQVDGRRADHRRLLQLDELRLVEAAEERLQLNPPAAGQGLEVGPEHLGKSV
ncbi:MAG: hypothetical protein IPH95_07145 [Candidatus Promineofilum sp.]|nr:hypothetical protein [Promineifilum sp.]